MVLGGTVTKPTRMHSKRSKQGIQPKLLMREGLEHARDDAEVERTAAILVVCQDAEVGSNFRVLGALPILSGLPSENSPSAV